MRQEESAKAKIMSGLSDSEKASARQDFFDGMGNFQRGMIQNNVENISDDDVLFRAFVAKRYGFDD